LSAHSRMPHSSTYFRISNQYRHTNIGNSLSPNLPFLNVNSLVPDTAYPGHTPFSSAQSLCDVSHNFTLHRSTLLVKAGSFVHVEWKMDDPVQLGRRVLRILHHLGIYSLKRKYSLQKQAVELFLISISQGNKSANIHLTHRNLLGQVGSSLKYLMDNNHSKRGAHRNSQYHHLIKKNHNLLVSVVDNTITLSSIMDDVSADTSDEATTVGK
jgi:hypothetical protein